MTVRARIPEGVTVADPGLDHGFVFWADPAVETWEDIKRELTTAFHGSRGAATAEESMVFVISNDALLGRSGAGPAMVAAGLLSAARTAAVEGARKGWTANVVAHDRDVEPAAIMVHVMRLLEAGDITGELVHVGPGHIGKALA